MKINVLNDDGSSNVHDINSEILFTTNNKKRVGYVNATSKEQTALDIVNYFSSDSKMIIFDKTNKLMEDRLTSLNIMPLSKMNNLPTIFDNQPFSMMFFTSGTTGEPVGALKTNENLLLEVKELSLLLKQYNIKKVIVTVPFIHIYGALVGLLYPIVNEMDIVIKEHFLPNDLINVIEPNSLIVTTPLYIKALNKLDKSIDLTSSLFISSTSPLDTKSANLFQKKYNTNIMQLFGSTETGGMAYKMNTDELWTPLNKVIISSNEKSELKVESPFISNILYNGTFVKTKNKIQTFDYVEIENGKFKLLGRSSQILKVAGKRYSTIQIEQILENEKDIEKALVYVKKNTDLLRDEILDITLETKREFTKKEIKNLLKMKLSNLKFDMDLRRVEKIELSNVGKKRRVI